MLWESVTVIMYSLFCKWLTMNVPIGYWYKPSLLVQRCNGSTILPGWVIWKHWNCPWKVFSLGSCLVSALSTPNVGEGYNASTDLNPNTITSLQLQCIQASGQHLADKTTSNHKQTPTEILYMYQSSPHQPPYCPCTCIWNKYPKRVALATKYLKLWMYWNTVGKIWCSVLKYY